MAGIGFIQSIIDSVDRGEKVIDIYLDLIRAFDSVSHLEILEYIDKL